MVTSADDDGSHSCSADHTDLRRRIERTNVTPIEGRERRQVTPEALRDSEFRQVFRRFVTIGRTPDLRSLTVTRTVTDEGEKYETVAVPFEVPGHEEAVIIWSFYELWGVRGFTASTSTVAVTASTTTGG